MVDRMMKRLQMYVSTKLKQVASISDTSLVAEHIEDVQTF